jgi:hypothetical protein
MKEKHVGFVIEQSTWESAMERLEHGEMSERLREVVTEIAYGADVSKRQRVKKRLDELREQRTGVQEEIRVLENKAERITANISSNERALEYLNDIDGEYEGALQVIEDIIYQGARIDVDHVQVKRAAEIQDIFTSDVILDLKDRNPDLPDEAFRWPKEGEPNNWMEANEDAN